MALGFVNVGASRPAATTLLLLKGREEKKGLLARKQGGMLACLLHTLLIRAFFWPHGPTTFVRIQEKEYHLVVLKRMVHEYRGILGEEGRRPAGPVKGALRRKERTFLAVRGRKKKKRSAKKDGGKKGEGWWWWVLEEGGTAKIGVERELEKRERREKKEAEEEGPTERDRCCWRRIQRTRTEVNKIFVLVGVYTRSVAMLVVPRLARMRACLRSRVWGLKVWGRKASGGAACAQDVLDLGTRFVGISIGGSSGVCSKNTRNQTTATATPPPPSTSTTTTTTTTTTNH
ncbi:hypothetical protein M0804_011377 [Polistes exclamans]|nr:hypothetical protein M0804_011377 [Polistes exclamans]